MLAEGFGRDQVIICDTRPLVAAANSEDSYHRSCTDLFTNLHLAGRQALVPRPVVAEVGYLLQRQQGSLPEASFLRSLAERVDSESASQGRGHTLRLGETWERERAAHHGVED